MQSNDTRSQAQPLPAPGYEMDDGLAAEWLFELAGRYHPSDALHVRALAKRLRTQHNEGLEAARQLARERADEIDSLKSEIDSLESDIMDSTRDLRDAEDRIRELRS